MERRRTKQEKRELEKLYGLAKDLNVKIFLCDEEDLGGAGALFLPPDEIYVPLGQSTSDLLLMISHELGHAISERLGEVSEKDNEAYERGYPTEDSIFCDEDDKEIIRFIEARAVYYSNKIIKNLQIKVSKSKLEIDNLYTMLSLEHVLDHGGLTEDSIEDLYQKAQTLFKQNIKWETLYKRFL